MMMPMKKKKKHITMPAPNSASCCVPVVRWPQ